MSIHNVTAHIGANPITIETGKLAKLATKYKIPVADVK